MWYQKLLQNTHSLLASQLFFLEKKNTNQNQNNEMGFQWHACQAAVGYVNNTHSCAGQRQLKRALSLLAEVVV